MEAVCVGSLDLILAKAVRQHLGLMTVMGAGRLYKI